MYECFASVQHMCAVPLRPEESVRIPWNWSYRCEPPLSVLGIEPCSSVRILVL